MNYLLPAALFASLLSGPALSQSAENGEKIFKKCAGCHKIGEDAKNSVGPLLTGVIGRAAGSASGYKYSKSMIAAGGAGLVWNQDTVFEYIADPTKYLRSVLNDSNAKAKMSFKLKSESDRRDVIAFLATFSTASVDVPNDEFCIVNASGKQHFFVVETREGERDFSNLQPGEQLCSTVTAALDGVVSVFESEDAFEGCSRLVPVGAAEEMLEFAEFDRCGWGSHNS